MDLKKKIGQRMVLGFKGIHASEEIKALIREYHIGGIILFGRNIGTTQEVLNLTKELQLEAKQAGYDRPLFICMDQENGAVRRLGEGATIMPGSMLLGATHQPDLAYKVGQITGRELKALGINWNLAPVVDVNNNPLNPVIGVRSFGEKPEVVAQFSLQAMRGMQDVGVMTTLKHFPGHGDTQVDSHLDLPVINHDLARLHEVELVPFKSCIDQGADTVMTAHVYFPTIEPEANRPATLSRNVITGLLREQLGFNGVVTTDCMTMDAISKRMGTPKGCMEAVKAGVDLIMVSHFHDIQEQSIHEIIRAVEHGEISIQEIDATLDRIHRLKDQYLSWEVLDVEKVDPIVGSNSHVQTAREIYEKGVTVVKGNLPIKIKSHERVLVLYPENDYAALVEDERYSTMTLGERFKQDHPNTHIVELKTPLQDQQIQEVLRDVSKYDYVVVGTLNASLDTKQQALLEQLSQCHVPTVAIAIRSPYDAKYLDFAEIVICTYEFSQPALQTAVEAILGKVSISGKLPITI